jgi:DNA (cytosine-5)-methyltransferase 1
MTFGFLEFFAGGGMARAGLGPGWTCLRANDFDPAKGRAYAANWGDDALVVGDVARLRAADMPGRADLAWASFPCQDLSLAGRGAGLGGGRSGSFWPFAALIGVLARDGRGPRLVAMENVAGLLTSRGGTDFASLVKVFAELGYRVGGMVVDAARFTPQSRPRLFVIAAAADCILPSGLEADRPCDWTTPPALAAACAALPPDEPGRLIWWRLPEPPVVNIRLIDLLEPDRSVGRWLDEAGTERILSLMNEANRAKVAAAQASAARTVGAVYRRTRPTPGGGRAQRAEIRFDGLAGCLRTPAGGSSRQTILIVEGDKLRARLLTPRECARLMGLPDDYRLPSGATDAYHLAGDGVVVPIVRHLAAHLFEPILSAQAPARLAAE